MNELLYKNYYIIGSERPISTFSCYKTQQLSGVSDCVCVHM